MTSRTNRRRYLILCCNVKCNTKSSPLLSLSFEARIECSRWCSSHFSSSQGATTVLQLSFASCCVSNDEKYYHRRDDVNARQNHTLSGEKSASESSSGRSKRCLQNASERRSIARDWSKWSIVEVLVDGAPSRAFARYV